MAPLVVDGSVLQSGPPDAENQVYDSNDAPFSLGQSVWDAGRVYRSLLDGNTAPLSDANSWADLGEVDGGALAYDSNTNYAVSTEQTPVLSVYEGAVWESAQSPNQGITPSEDGTAWTRIGATNRLKAFDGFLQDAATQDGSLSYDLQFSELVTDLAILRAAGSEVRVTMTAAVGQVYDKTFPLIDDSTIVDAWEYFFAPFNFQDTVLVEGLPPYAGAEIRVEVSGESTSVSQILSGIGLALGTVRVGTSVGLESYSRKERDDFNRSIVVSRPYSDTVAFDVQIPTTQVGYVSRRLAERESARSLFYMSDGAPYGAVVYGIPKDFHITHETHVMAESVLEIEGLG